MCLSVCASSTTPLVSFSSHDHISLFLSHPHCCPPHPTSSSVPLSSSALLSKSRLLPPLLFIPSLETSFLQGKNSTAHFVSLSASIYAPLLPSFFFILSLSLRFHLLSPSDNRFWDPSIENSPFALLASQWLALISSLVEFCPVFTVQKKKRRRSGGKERTHSTKHSHHTRTQ